ncbi:hypothetical protein Bca52824_076321 [Brassica carinata]|uniref:Uncharacterized protein n=1 Tax=Brassica carinata TaxID=52824 RepID=A0A8X7TWJ3_BRACI|nr:hypothetical protein Bca52824_076321 [Brassica carinata]
MSCIRYGEGGKGMADGGCSVSSIEGVHDSYIVVISGGGLYATRPYGEGCLCKVDNFIEDWKRAIIESYGLVGMFVAVEMSYWLGEPRILSVGERSSVQISKDKDFDLFT